jgi:hypothetical protein
VLFDLAKFAKSPRIRPKRAKPADQGQRASSRQRCRSKRENGGVLRRDYGGQERPAVFHQSGQVGRRGNAKNRADQASLRRAETPWHHDGTALARQWHCKP